MSSIYYFYPKYKTTSFSVIAQQHIRYLSRRVNIFEFDIDFYSSIYWAPGKRILVHPIFYSFIGLEKAKAEKALRKLYRLRNVASRLGGFDVADTDRISETAVELANRFDLIIVPSTFAKEAYVRSGVEIPVEVLPHGIPEEFQVPVKKITNKTIKELYKFKREKKAIFILYFLWHSGFRKGADVLAAAIEQVFNEFDNVYLIIKRMETEDPYLKELRGPRTREIATFLSWDELRQLYDICDIAVVPSRGGGFELNALEAISRGLITIVPEAGPFLDYIQYTIPFRVKGRVKIFEDNPVHVGYGWDPDPEDLARKIIFAIDNLQKLRTTFANFALEIRTKYSWAKICNRLYSILLKYGFVG